MSGGFGDVDIEAAKVLLELRYNGAGPAPAHSSNLLGDHTRQRTENLSDLVPIGRGYTLVPERLVRRLGHMYFTVATRCLMSAVFTREEMATRTLSGRPSPAFPNHPVKSRLDPRKIDDIVSTVVEYCNASESVVRSAITTKCADETKMHRIRLMKMRAKKENIAPSTSRSSTSSNNDEDDDMNDSDDDRNDSDDRKDSDDDSDDHDNENVAKVEAEHLEDELD